MQPQRNRFINRGQAQTAQHHAQQPVQPQTNASKPSFFGGRRWVWVLVVSVLVVIIAGLSFEYIHTKNQLNAAKNPTEAGKTEAEKITNKINGIVQLPTNETPTLATVNDVSKLKTQQFFKNAQNGDKVLVYQSSGLAVLYRPSTNKVILFSFVSTNGTNQ